MPRSLMGSAILMGLVVLAGCRVETFWSPDGKTIAYLANGELRLYDVATKESKALDAGADKVVSVAWSPDGTRIAFYAATLGQEADVSLRVIAPGSGTATTLVREIWPVVKEAPAEAAAASPDDALRAAQEDDLGSFSFAAALDWSPDGKRLAYVGAAKSLSGVFVVTHPGGAVEAIPADRGSTIAPAWSPDGKWLAYVCASYPPAPADAEEADQAGESDTLWLYDPATKKSAKVCDVPGDGLAMGTRLQWSSDSRQLGFIAMGAEEAIGCLVEAQPGGAVRQALPGVTPMAAWSPGLDGMAYLGQTEEEDEVPLLYRALGAESPRVVGKVKGPVTGGEDTGMPLAMGDTAAMPFTLPQFSPDGRQIALTVGEKSDVRVMVFAVK